MAEALPGAAEPGLTFLSGGGGMGALIRAHDWSATPLGGPEGWPQSLRSAVSIMLGSSFPTAIYWGADLRLLYNDAWAPIPAERHPEALGWPGAEVWPDIWDVVGPQFARVLETGEGFSAYDQMLRMMRAGTVAETYWNYSFTPIRGEDGSVAGVFNQGNETTARVLGERRQAFRLKLEERMRATGEQAEVMQAASRMLGQQLDVSRVGYAEVDEDGYAHVERDWAAPGVGTVAGRHRLEDFGPELAAELRAGRTVRVADAADDRLTASEATAQAFRALGVRSTVDVPLVRRGRLVAILFVHNPEPRRWTDEEVELVEAVAERIWATVERVQAEAALREETRTLETLNRTGAALAAELDLERLVQRLTDAATELTGARFGAYFHNVMDETGERLHLYTLSGADRAAFEKMGRPRATPVFGPTFRNEGVIRSEDILADPRYGRNAPHKGMPRGHLPVRSYLAVSVVSRTGEVLGGLLFGHPEPGRFTERHERLMLGLAAQASIAVDNARLFQAVQGAKETLERRVEERTKERNRIWTMSQDLLAVMGFDGYLKAVNPAWEATLGFDGETLLSRPLPQQVHPDDLEAAAAAVERLSRGESVPRFEDRLRHADGSWRWIAWALVPEGDVFYAVGRDVTAEKEAAAELESAQEALRQSQKMEAVGQLTGGIAHDFNNLLQGVAGSLDLIRRRADDPERVRRFAEAGLEAAARGAKLTGQLLAFSRAQRIEARPVAVSGLVEGMRDMLERTLGPQVGIVLDLADRGAAVLSDPTQIEMAVLNLAINARDAMPDGGSLTIATRVRSIEAHRDLDPGDYVELAVADSGTGMPPDVAARAFDPFFTTKGVGKGTGLGLSQVYGIARQAGGMASIESRPGGGTTVRLLLRVTGRVTTAEAEAAEDKSQDRAATATVLVVDDDASVRRFLVDSLDALGYRVIEAADGQAGLAALAREEPDLMVLDFAMPGMNGAEVAKAARERLPDLPIVFASGYSDTAAIESVVGPGVPMLRKPFGVADLQRAVGGALAVSG